MKPLLNVARTEDELRQKEEELNKLREKVQRDDASRKEIEEQQTQLMEEKNQLFIQLQRVSKHTHTHYMQWLACNCTASSLLCPVTF